MTFNSKATDLASFYRDVAMYDLEKRRRDGVAAPSAGVTKPLNLDAINNINDLMTTAKGWHQDNVKRRGGAAFDMIDDNPDSVYSTRRYQFLERLEAKRPWAYDDVTGKTIEDPSAKKGNITVGIGFNMDRPDARKVFSEATGLGDADFDAVYAGKKKLDEVHIRRLFDHTIREAEDVVTRRVGDNIPEHQRLALVSMAFNGPALIGPNFSRMVKQGDEEGALKAILYYSNKNRIKGLANRRYQEAAQFVGPSVAQAKLPEYRKYIKDYV